MSKKNEFYVKLPSNAGGKEFPTNKRFDGNHWKVALNSASLPDSAISIANQLVRKYTYVMQVAWFKATDTARANPGTLQVKMEDLLERRTFETGEQLMRTLTSMIDAAVTVDMKSGESLLHHTSGKRMFPEIQWEKVGEELELVLNNSKKHYEGLKWNPLVSFDVEFAMKMGWVRYDSPKKDYVLGPNLILELIKDGMSNDKDFVASFEDNNGRPALFRVLSGKQLSLSSKCHWRFKNLNFDYRSIVGTPNQILHLYSSACNSSVVGNQSHPLLREVQY